MKKNSRKAASYGDDFPEFFKIYLPDCTQQLKIPLGFVAKFLKDVPRNFIVEGPERRCWIIAARKDGESVYLGEGWPRFVQDNSLERGDFLTFAYDGVSILHVKIFAKHACRKDVELSEEPRSRQLITRKTSGPRDDGDGGKLIIRNTGMVGGRTLRPRDETGKFNSSLVTKRTFPAQDDGCEGSTTATDQHQIGRRLRPRDNNGKFRIKQSSDN